MTKVVEIARTSEYWVSRAHKHRLAGRYDEAMALLGKTREQYGTSEALERELAQTYEELGCEDEAARAYLRVARMNGEYRMLCFNWRCLPHSARICLARFPILNSLRPVTDVMFLRIWWRCSASSSGRRLKRLRRRTGGNVPRHLSDAQ